MTSLFRGALQELLLFSTNISPVMIIVEQLYLHQFVFSDPDANSKNFSNRPQRLKIDENTNIKKNQGRQNIYISVY